MAAFKSILACACAVVAVALTIVEIKAEVYIQPPLRVPEKYECCEDEGCYSDILDVILPFEIPVNPIDGVHCRRFLCQENGNTVVESCGVIAVPPECTIVQNMSLPYPDCCSKPLCSPTK